MLSTQFFLIQFRKGEAIALWQVPAENLNDAILIMHATYGHKHGDTYSMAWSLQPKIIPRPRQ